MTTRLHEAWEAEVAVFLDSGMGLEDAWRRADDSVPGHDADGCAECIGNDEAGDPS